MPLWAHVRWVEAHARICAKCTKACGSADLEAMRKIADGSLERPELVLRRG